MSRLVLDSAGGNLPTCKAGGGHHLPAEIRIYEKQPANRDAIRLNPADTHARSARNDWFISGNHRPACEGRSVPEARTAEPFNSSKRPDRLLDRRGKRLDQSASRYPGQEQQPAKLVDSHANWRYRSPVAAKSAAGFGDPSNLAHKRPIRQQALFLCLPFRVMAAVRGIPSGMPGSKFPVRQPAHSCHPNSFGDDQWQLQTKLGAPHMHTLNPSAAQQHAAAWKARALAALRADSSLSVRLNRYNAAMARARALEAQEVEHV